jgi:osmotically-inducible protein OsmY
MEITHEKGPHGRLRGHDPSCIVGTGCFGSHGRGAAVQASGEATEEKHEANEAVGETDDTVITTRVRAALLQDPGTAALAIEVETFMGGVQLSGSVDSVDKKQRAQDIAERVDGVIAVDNALSVK